jgi:hypothetical protein
MSVNKNPTERTDVTQPRIAVVLDLCLYRAVADCCQGCVLPFGVRQMIKDFAFEQFDNATVRKAVNLWCSVRADAAVREHQRLEREPGHQYGFPLSQYRLQ